MGKGYNNYMCKKPFHPGSKANIKRAWMAEQKTENDKKKQDELKVQYEKEQDLYKNKALISSESKDKLELNFMYEAPPGAKRERQKEDDEPEYKFEWQRKYNAPREDYAKGNADIKDQPFGIPVRNVRCIKCHKWGHINTDKECPLFSQASTSSMPTTSMDPMELMRQMREDGFGLKENVLGHHLNPKAANQQLIPSDDESDPEAEFLKSLSTADKKKLLRKLKKLSKKQEKKAKSKKKKSKKTKKKSTKKDSSDSDSDEKPKRKKKRKESSSCSSKSSSSDSNSEHETTKEKTGKTQFMDDQRYVSSRDDRNSKLYPFNLEPDRKHHSKESNEWEAEDKSHPKDRNKSYRHAKDQRCERNYSYDQNDVKPGSKRCRDPDDTSSKKYKISQQHSSSSSDLENEHVNAKQKHDKTKYDQKCKSYKDDKMRNAKFDSEEYDRNHHSKESYEYEPSRKHEQTERSYKLSKDSRNDENTPDVHPQIKSESRSKDAVSDEVDEKSKSHHLSKNNSINKRQSPDTYKATKTYKPENTGIIIRSVQEFFKKIKKDSIDEKSSKNKEAPTHPDGFSHTCPQAVIPANYEPNTKEYAGVQHDKFRDFYRDDRSPSVKQKYNK